MNSVQTVTNNLAVSDSYLDALIDSLQDPIESASYLTAIIEAENPEPELLPLALHDISKALDKTGANVQSLEMILQKQGAESVYGLVDWLKGFGLKLTVTVAETLTKDNKWDFKEIQGTTENIQTSNKLKSRITVLEEELVRLRQELDGVNVKSKFI